MNISNIPCSVCETNDGRKCEWVPRYPASTQRPILWIPLCHKCLTNDHSPFHMSLRNKAKHIYTLNPLKEVLL